jgi:hypothetical protein
LGRLLINYPQEQAAYQYPDTKPRWFPRKIMHKEHPHSAITDALRKEESSVPICQHMFLLAEPAGQHEEEEEAAEEQDEEQQRELESLMLLMEQQRELQELRVLGDELDLKVAQAQQESLAKEEGVLYDRQPHVSSIIAADDDNSVGEGQDAQRNSGYGVDEWGGGGGGGYDGASVVAFVVRAASGAAREEARRKAEQIQKQKQKRKDQRERDQQSSEVERLELRRRMADVFRLECCRWKQAHPHGVSNEQGHDISFESFLAECFPVITAQRRRASYFYCLHLLRVLSPFHVLMHPNTALHPQENIRWSSERMQRAEWMDARCQGPEWRGVFFNAQPAADLGEKKACMNVDSLLPSSQISLPLTQSGVPVTDREQQLELEEQQQELESLFEMMEQQQELQQLHHIQAELSSGRS